MMFTQRYRSHHSARRQFKEGFVLSGNPEQYVRSILEKPRDCRKTIYIHVPFCRKICNFCAMFRSLRQDQETYFNQLKAQIEALSPWAYMQDPIDSIYFGGGTPTALTSEMMASILDLLHKHFNLVDGVEVSVETTATELDEEMLKSLKAGGVNRLSVGIQTFNDPGRELMNRYGTGDFARSRLHLALDAGIKNTNMDLIYTYPGQSLDDLAQDLKTMQETDIAGFSFYGLNLLDASVFANSLSQDQIDQVNDPGRERAMFDLIYESMGAAGFKLLELNKMVKPGRDSYEYIHIRNQGGDTIALGDGAGGSFASYSYYNRYPLRSLAPDLAVSAMGQIYDPSYRLIREFDFAWQQAEVDMDLYGAKLELDLWVILEDLLEKYDKAGLIKKEGQVIKLTQSGIFWGYNMINEIIETLVERAYN